MVDVLFEMLSQTRACGIQKAELNGNVDAENNHGGSSTKDIIRLGTVKTSACAYDLADLLDTKSPGNQSDPKSLE
jgi:hypothetical protein